VIPSRSAGDGEVGIILILRGPVLKAIPWCPRGRSQRTFIAPAEPAWVLYVMVEEDYVRGTKMLQRGRRQLLVAVLAMSLAGAVLPPWLSATGGA